MKKLLFVLICLTISIVSCERDDICLEPTTPNLIIRFYDSANPTETKTVSNLYVWADSRDSLYVNTSTDSIAIPLNSNATQTLYNFSQSTTQDQITFDYLASEVFVSRSCGFKANYSDLSTPSVSNNWIQSVSIENTTIDNETTAHVKIFH